MSQITRRRIRMALDIAKKSSERFTDVRNGGTPELWKGNDVQFEVGLFDNAVIISDTSNIASLTITIRQATSAGAILMTKTLTGAELTACLQAAWTAGTGQHALVTFTGEEANVATGTHWLACAIVTNDFPGQSVTTGCTNITITEDGIGSDTQAQTHDGLAYTKDQADARFIQIHGDLSFFQASNGNLYFYELTTDKWYPLVVTIKDAIPTLTLGEGVTL